MVKKFMRASIGPLALAAIVAGTLVGVPWPSEQVFSQEVSHPGSDKVNGDKVNGDKSDGDKSDGDKSDGDKAVPPDAKPKAAPGGDQPANPGEPAAKPTWLQSQDMTGSSSESEIAVDLALAWLAAHQYPIGGWSFDHRLGPCQGRCANPGTMAKAVNGATGLALLPFIDHGNTHQTGPYRQNVAAGLQFLLTRMGKDGSAWEPGGTMYSHALALMALCEDLRVEEEASGRSTAFPSRHSPGPAGKKGVRPATGHAAPKADPKTAPKADPKTARETAQQRKQRVQREMLDRMVPVAATQALAFALSAQDPLRGGWRYDPRRPDSDISVTGWHVMALHSAETLNLTVPARTTLGVTALLDSLQGDYGASYGYHRSAAEATPTRSAIGLLCRIYTGWNRPQLQRGAETLAAIGPSEFDMYYNYYGTLLLHHYGGPLWDDWNRKLRDYLIRTQSRHGHETGSWSFRACHSNSAGGRHFDTCMACLILETYYRSKPAYTSPQAPKEKPAELPAGKAGEAPAGKAGEAPAGKPGEAPAAKAGEAPAKSEKADAPSAKSGETPAPPQ